MERSKSKPSLARLAGYSRQGGRICGVCSSPHRKFIEQAIAAGNSKRAIREYFAEELGIKLPTLNHHIANHAPQKT